MFKGYYNSNNLVSKTLKNNKADKKKFYQPYY
jgi:hypothetical protein